MNDKQVYKDLEAIVNEYTYASKSEIREKIEKYFDYNNMSYTCTILDKNNTCEYIKDGISIIIYSYLKFLDDGNHIFNTVTINCYD